MYTKTKRQAGSSKSENFKQAKYKKLLIAALLIVGVEFALLVWLKGLSDQALTAMKKKENPVLSLSGRLEIEQTRVASLVAGRIENVFVKEGERVNKGQLLCSLEDKAIVEGRNAAESAISDAKRMLVSAQAQRLKLQAKLNASPDFAVEDTSGASVVGASTAANADGSAVDELDNSTSSSKRPGFGKKALRFITAPVRLISKPITAAGAKAEQAEKNIKAELARAKLESQQALARAKRESKQALIKAKRETEQLALAQVNAQIMLAESGLRKAQASKTQVDLKEGYFKVASPIDGVCSNVLIHKGELVSAGKPLILINDSQSAYMRGFVPEGQVSQLKIGQSATVFLDSVSAERKSVSAHLSSIDPKPSFTPENVYFKDDRVKQVFGVKLRIDEPNFSVEAGLPCDAEIHLKESLEK